MKKIVWTLRCDTLPAAVHYCKKCGTKTEFVCSEQFRVNAQKKCLDIWLIYKCSTCDTTWNAAVCSRVTPQSLDPVLLNGFHANDRSLAAQYAANSSFLQKNGAEIQVSEYTIDGEWFHLGEAVELEINSSILLPIRVSAIIRKKLSLSQKQYACLISSGVLKCSTGQDLLKCRLGHRITLTFSEIPISPKDSSCSLN